MGRVIHFEIPADDPQRAIDFYKKVFGWKIEKWNGPMNYWLVMTGDSDKPGIDGAIMEREPIRVPVNTIDVDSLDDTVKAVEASGGKVIAPRMPVPGVGWMAYCTDSEGNLFGLMQSDVNAN